MQRAESIARPASLAAAASASVARERVNRCQCVPQHLITVTSHQQSLGSPRRHCRYLIINQWAAVVSRCSISSLLLAMTHNVYVTWSMWLHSSIQTQVPAHNPFACNPHPAMTPIFNPRTTPAPSLNLSLFISRHRVMPSWFLCCYKMINTLSKNLSRLLIIGSI